MTFVHNVEKNLKSFRKWFGILNSAQGSWYFSFKIFAQLKMFCRSSSMGVYCITNSQQDFNYSNWIEVSAVAF